MTGLAGVKNKYGGIFIRPDELPDRSEDFETQLTASLAHWRTSGIKVVWLKLSPTRSNLIPTALRHGFEYHHCTTSEVMMVNRLVAETVLPSSGTHTIGVGAIVLTENLEILTIVEKRDLHTRPNHYKFPGGMLEPGEHIASGVIREVFEETGIETAFEGLISFRHHHNGQFDTSNIYAVCKLTPLSRTITIDENEIGKALWMPLSKYMQIDGVGIYNKHIIEDALNSNYLTSVKLNGYMSGAGDYEIFSPL